MCSGLSLFLSLEMTRGDHGNDHTRDPCPYVIVYDIGIGFGLGAGLGTLINTYKGYRNSPRGERFSGIVSAVKARAPIQAGGFAVWSGLFNSGECALFAIRGKEDAWNPIMAGAATGTLLAVRSGPTAMAISGLMGGIFLACIEGASVLMSKMTGSTEIQPIVLPPEMSEPKKKEETETQEPPRPRGLFSGRFGLTA